MNWTDELRYGFRALRKDRGFSLATIFALALSLGANTAVFTVVKSVLLEPLPMRDPERLVALWSMRPDGQDYPFNIPNFFDIRERNQGLEDMAACGGWNANLTGEADPERLLGVRATANYFQMLGVQAAMGRVLEPADDAPGAPKVVVLTEHFWQRRYAGDREILGKRIRLNGDSYAVVGVLPASFSFFNPATELAIALAPDADPFRGNRKSVAFLRVFARLRSGVSQAQAKANLDAVAAQLFREYPDANLTHVGVKLVPLREELTGTSRPMLTSLMAAVLLVLLITCTNISSLTVARAARRRRELAIQAAMGGGRWRLARQRLIETVLLSLVGGAMGVVLAHWGVALLLAISPASLPRANEVRLDWVAAAIGLALALLCGVLCGAIPAWQSANLSLAETLRGDGRASTGDAGRTRVRNVLVIAEVSLSLLLLAGAGLMLKSFQRILTSDSGFRTANLETLRLALPSTRYQTAESVAHFHDQLRARLQSVPGVSEVGAISILPLSGPTASIDFTIDGQPPLKANEKPTTEYRMTDSTYFRAMGIPILSGRGFSDHDTAASQTVVIVSQTLARLYWKDRNPVGTHVKLEDNSKGFRDAEVVGVSGDVKELSLEKPATPCLFVALPQIPPNVVRFVTNNFFWAIATRPGVSVKTAARQQVHEVDGDVSASAALMESWVERGVSARRFTLRILAVFAMAAFLLAASGIYALISYTTAQRTREIGVRMALGARSSQVGLLVVREGLGLAMLGVGIGLAAAWVLSRYLAPQLAGVSPHDPRTLGGAGAVLLVAAGVASYVPARRAIQVDPAGALRGE